MAGIVDGILGAALGASTGLVGNAKLQQQTEADEAKENRLLGREAFLMELRSKYNQADADHNNKLELGRMDKQGAIARDNAKYQNDLQLNAMGDPRAVAADKLKRDNAMADWVKQNGVTHQQALELLRQKQSGDRSLMDMRIAAKGKGRGGADDDDEIGDPDFIGARKGLYGYLGIDAGADEGEMRAAMKRLGLPDKATPKVAQEVLKAATNVYAANPHLSPDEALQFGRDVIYGKTRLATTKLPDGRRIQTFVRNGKAYSYGRPE